MKKLEWLKDKTNQSSVYTDADSVVYGDEYVISRELMLDLIDQVEQPELPVIPEYVAQYIEYNKQIDMDVNTLFIHATGVCEEDVKDTDYWIVHNAEEFVVAYNRGYTVEEKKYRVLVGKGTHTTGLFLSKSPHSGDVTVGTNLDYYYNDTGEVHLTEQEIKDYDERYWAFAEEINE